MPDKPSIDRRERGLGRNFGALRVRPKLMLLHNVFFLTLSAAVYLSLLPMFEEHVAQAGQRERQLVAQAFALGSTPDSLPTLRSYAYREGNAASLGVPPAVRARLDALPARVEPDPAGPERLYRRDPATGRYQGITLPRGDRAVIVRRAKVNLFVVLAVIYLLAIAILEWIIMPAYVYRPLRLMLHADRATLEGDRRAEMIDDSLILDDEIGQIMRSRNQTVGELRRQEDGLAAALAQLERVAADLQIKNDQLETAKQTLADQDRLVSLGLLSASVAHELNTPLAVLHGSVEKLIETVPDAHSQDRLARMLRVTQRLRTISEGLVDFARVRKQEMEPIAVRALIEEAWSLVGIDEKAARVTLRNRVPDGERFVGNFDRLIQVFLNLLRNALLAIPEGGRIEVASQRQERDGRSWVCVTVDDNGPGIPSDVLPNIFTAFVSTRLDSRGTGLGLTVAEGIIQQHGGTICASNRPEGGARLQVTLPSAASVPAADETPHEVLS